MHGGVKVTDSPCKKCPVWLGKDRGCPFVEPLELCPKWHRIEVLVSEFHKRPIGNSGMYYAARLEEELEK
jgi:hypothetical protein